MRATKLKAKICPWKSMTILLDNLLLNQMLYVTNLCLKCTTFAMQKNKYIVGFRGVVQPGGLQGPTKVGAHKSVWYQNLRIG